MNKKNNLQSVMKDFDTDDNTGLRRDKTTEAQEGRSFEKICAEETERKIRRQVEACFGKNIRSDEERPWPGAFAIVSEKIVGAWMAMLAANGLHRFGDKISIDWFTKGKKVERDKLRVEETPVGGQPSFHFPKSEREDASLSFRLAVVDPQFMTAAIEPAFQELPKEYIVAVLNTLNPYALYQIFGNDLPELLKRAGTYADAFEQLLKVVVGRWEHKKIPDDYETLQDYLHLALIHEMVHALALHLPDKVPADLPELAAISYENYLKIINTDQLLQTSVVFYKNLLKALQSVEKLPVSAETASKVIDLLALEMLCDRFSMFLYENFLKIRVYNELLEESLGYPVYIDMYTVFEKARRAGTLAERSEVSHLDDSALQQLEQDLKDAERDHVYIRKFDDPTLTAAELNFYWDFLDWLKYLDSNNKILRFNMAHANDSRFIHASVERLTHD